MKRFEVFVEYQAPDGEWYADSQCPATLGIAAGVSYPCRTAAEEAAERLRADPRPGVIDRFTVVEWEA